MILNAYWGLRNFIVLYACCSQKPLTQNSVLIFFPLNKSLTPTFLYSLNKLFTPPQNCDAHPRHVCCVWSIPSCFEGEEGDNNLVFSAIHAPYLVFFCLVLILFTFFILSSHLPSSSFFSPAFFLLFYLISHLIHISIFLSFPVSSPLLSFPSWLLSLMWLFCASVLFCVCILDNRVSQLWLIFYWLNEKLSAKLK